MAGQPAGPLRDWTAKNRRRAVLAVDRTGDGGDRRRVRHLHPRATRYPPRRLVDDPTARLLGDCIAGRPLSDEEIVSIIRNWTVAELSTIAASAGVVAAHLARHPDVQRTLREDPTLLDAATDEIQRINSPFVASRRRVTRDVEIAGTPVAAGDRVYVVWATANRDPRVFGDPDEFRLDRDPADNLVYGRGVHVCPGAPLARPQWPGAVRRHVRRDREDRTGVRRGSHRPIPRRRLRPAAGESDVRPHGTPSRGDGLQG